MILTAGSMHKESSGEAISEPAYRRKRLCGNEIAEPESETRDDKTVIPSQSVRRPGSQIPLVQQRANQICYSACSL